MARRSSASSGRWRSTSASGPAASPAVQDGVDIGPHRRYPRHWFAFGYGGNGRTLGFLAPRMLLERWQGTLISPQRPGATAMSAASNRQATLMNDGRAIASTAGA